MEQIKRLLAAFPEADRNLGRSKSPVHYPSRGISTLAEPLTPRELEVLTWLQGTLSIKEIALKLNISSSTTQRHTINLYGKLGVSGRREAVAKAEELSLLPPR